MTKRILVADDEAHYRDDLKAFLESYDFSVDVGTNYLDTIAYLKENSYALIVCDKGMPIREGGRIHHKCGLEIFGFAKLHPQHKNTPFILHTASELIDIPDFFKQRGGIYHEKNTFRPIGAVMLKLLGIDR